MKQLRSLVSLSIIATLSIIFAAFCGIGSAIIDTQYSRATEYDSAMTADYDRDLMAVRAQKLQKAADKAAVIAREQAYQESIKPDIPAFSKGSSATLVRKIITTKPVVFLTMDDGIIKNPDALKYIKDHRLNPMLFLTNSIIADNYDYFKDYQAAGLKIENHTLTHPNLRKLGYAAQKAEICGQTDKIKQIYGTTPTIMRPPYGEFNNNTLQASHDCGIDFVVHWSAKVDGGAVQYQTGKHLVAGDVVLMHFRPAIMDDLKAFNDEVTAQGLTPAYLSDWLQ